MEADLEIQKASAGLDRLIQVSKRLTWDPDVDLDWQLPTPQLTARQQEALTRILSLIYWSDKSGQSSLALMADHLERRFWSLGTYQPDEVLLKVQNYLRIQRDDEVRHALTLEKLFERLGSDPASPSWVHAQVLRTLAIGQDFDEKLIIIHWVVEIYAKLLFEQLRDRFPSTLIATVFGKILQDESRHIAFGDYYLPMRVREASPLERIGLLRAQIHHLTLMGWGALTESYGKAAHALDLDVRQLFEEGLDAMEHRHERLGSPWVPCNLSPWLRPLAGLIS